MKKLNFQGLGRIEVIEFKINRKKLNFWGGRITNMGAMAVVHNITNKLYTRNINLCTKQTSSSKRELEYFFKKRNGNFIIY